MSLAARHARVRCDHLAARGANAVDGDFWDNPRMPSPSARTRIFTYAAAVALLNLAILLPGNPDFGSTRGVVVGLAIQALIVWRLWHGSELAWLFGVGGPLLAMASIVLMAADMTFGVVLFLFLCFLQVAILCAPPMLSFIWSQPARPATPR